VVKCQNGYPVGVCYNLLGVWGTSTHPTANVRVVMLSDENEEENHYFPYLFRNLLDPTVG
jgi:hypothetical protein